ncbi:hypothetical protein AYI69_g776 [Smittium culicis]|uniref:Uncharacterized protein n=1 Tax=Smittium culicis TaxID=133412 RepID=A0A1R1YS49_9FUNG|nr:hypothetical protein AYI69_g776 [Smittium culicis]
MKFVSSIIFIAASAVAVYSSAINVDQQDSGELFVKDNSHFNQGLQNLKQLNSQNENNEILCSGDDCGELSFDYEGFGRKRCRYRKRICRGRGFRICRGRGCRRRWCRGRGCRRRWCRRRRCRGCRKYRRPSCEPEEEIDEPKSISIVEPTPTSTIPESSTSTSVIPEVPTTSTIGNLVLTTVQQNVNTNVKTRFIVETEYETSYDTDYITAPNTQA